MFIKNLKPLTNYDIINLVNELKISNFRGVFMKDALPKQINNKRSKASSSPGDIEYGILNLDVSKNNGTHCIFRHLK
jgi:hypothetical protein